MFNKGRVWTCAGIIGAAVLFFPSFPAAQEIPKALQPPPGEQKLLQVHATGDQIYTCQSSGGQFAWVSKAPDAQLTDAAGKSFGRHFAGPSWQAKDGSQVTGKAVISVASPDAESIPWLLLAAKDHIGNGALSRVTSIQRISTRGGKAPATGCDADHVGQEQRTSYSADYVFFAPK
jgi:hypothetical protein